MAKSGDDVRLWVRLRNDTAELTIQFLRSDLEGKVTHVQDAVHLGREAGVGTGTETERD